MGGKAVDKSVSREGRLKVKLNQNSIRQSEGLKVAAKAPTSQSPKLSRNTIQRVQQSANNAVIKDVVEIPVRRNGVRKQSETSASYRMTEGTNRQGRNNFFDINQSALVMSQQPHQFEEIRELAAEEQRQSRDSRQRRPVLSQESSAQQHRV